jgi:hypothetical protein
VRGMAAVYLPLHRVSGRTERWKGDSQVVIGSGGDPEERFR